MKWLWCGFLLMWSLSAAASEQRVYLLSKRQIVDSNHTLVVFFYDRSVTSLADCEREIQRGIRGQWRYYTHKFPKPKGYSENLDYHCIRTAARIDPWYDKATYDFIYQIDLRSNPAKIKRMPHYAECLRDLREHIRDENRVFFCAKVSQGVNL
jgi:hypothetical protein